MKSLILSALLALTSSTLQASENDAHLIHAIHLIDMASNAAAVGSFTVPVSQEIKNKAYTIFGHTGRIENLLIYMAPAYGVDFTADPLPVELVEAKAKIQEKQTIFLNAEACYADEAYAEVFESINELKADTLLQAEKEDVSPSLREFIKSNL